MNKNNESFHVRSKVWVEDSSGNVVFGLGRLKMIEAISRLGSIQAAAKELKMSYRAVWGRIKATEERLNQLILIRNIGGVSGGGSQLTPFAQKLLEQFYELHKCIIKESDKQYSRTLEPHLGPNLSTRSMPAKRDNQE